jgi:hypothetical protein
MDAADSLLGASEEVTIAVIDTGIDASHPSVRGHLWEGPGGMIGYDFLDGDPDPDESREAGPVAGHGTFIAGLIALAAPKVRIMPLRVLSGEGTGSAFDAAEAINYAAQNGARVISMSFGTEGSRVPHVLRDAIRSAYDRGVVLVAAAGNDAERAVPYPASDDERVIAVGACGYDSQAGFSNYGRHVDISAPGVGLVSAMPGTYPEDGRAYRYARWSGTSFSTGLVSAACAVLLATEGVGEPPEVFRRIQENGDDLEGGSRVGKRINFLEAVGSVFRDAGALDVWSVANLWSAEDAEYPLGHVVLRTIGDVERLTADGWGVEPLAEHGLYLLTADREYEAGRAVADAFGSLTLVLSGAPGASEHVLPVPLREVAAVELRNAAGEAVCRAAIAPDAPGLQSWAGVGMKAPGGEGEAFGWAWYSLEWPSMQRISIALCALEEGATYVLRVNGTAVARQTLPVGVEPSVTFWFSNYDCDLEDGAEPLPDALAPVTRTGLVEVWKVDAAGETLVASGNFSGAAKHMPGAR